MPYTPEDSQYSILNEYRWQALQWQVEKHQFSSTAAQYNSIWWTCLAMSLSKHIQFLQSPLMNDAEFLASCPHLEAQKWLPPWRSIIQFALQIRQRNTVSDKGTESAATLCYTAPKVGQPVSVSLLLGCLAPLVDSWLTTSYVVHELRLIQMQGLLGGPT